MGCRLAALTGGRECKNYVLDQCNLENGATGFQLQLTSNFTAAVKLLSGS